MVDVPRGRHHRGHHRERGETAPISPPAAGQLHEEKAGDEEGKRLLDEQAQAREQTRRRGDPGASQAVARQQEPHGHRDHRRLWRVEHHHVQLADHHRGPQSEHDGQEPAQPSSLRGHRPGAVAAGGEQRYEDDVLHHDRPAHADSAHRDPERAHQVQKRRVRGEGLERLQHALVQEVVVEERVAEVLAVVEVGHP